MAALDTLVTAAVSLGSGGFHRNRITDALLSLELRGASDFRSISVAKLRSCLRKTLTSCQEVREHYPELERPYRLRRRWFAASALMLVSGRLLASAQALLGADSIPGKPRSHRPIGALLRASSLRSLGRVLQAVLAVAPKATPRRVDDACVRMVLAFLAATESAVERLDQENASIESRRRAWLRLEVCGNAEAADESSRLLQAKQELLWTCPTRVSTLILLSALRDNNTGMYRHPTLSRRFAPLALSQTLSRIHRETCEELLNYPFLEIVRELELYANQTRADEISFLSNWKSIRAYRMTRPAELDLYTSYFFEFTLDLAVAALEARRR